jgi:hypothetical protein
LLSLMILIIHIKRAVVWFYNSIPIIKIILSKKIHTI